VTAEHFGAISVELDAIEPNQLRPLVQDAIEFHLPPHQFAVLKAAEASEQIITEGKPQYAIVLKWRSRDLADHFSDAVVVLVRQQYPDALGDEP
jgi:hypothetical protein